MKKLKLKLKYFEAAPLTKRELEKVLGGIDYPTTQPNESSSPQYTVTPFANKEVETSQET